MPGTPCEVGLSSEAAQCERQAPMRVLHVMPQIGIGGAETQLLELIIHSDPAEIRHEVLYYSDSLDEEGFRLYRRSGVSLNRVARARHRPLQFIQRLSRAIRTAQPDLVHCWLARGGMWGRLAAIRAGIKSIIVSYRGTYVPAPLLVRWLEKATAERVVIATNSRGCAREVGRQIGVSADRFEVIYNGVDLARFSADIDRAALRRELGVPPGVPIIVNVGRLTPAKNHDMLLRLARRCRGVLPAHFVLVGHGEREEELKAGARSLGLMECAHFLGLRRDVASILRGADLFCYTSTREGFPNALLEAMAAGLPIVTTDFSGVDELIEHGKNGLIVPQNDVEAMFRAISGYLSNREQAAACGARAASDAQARFSLERMVADTLGLYRRIVAGHQ